MSTPLFGGNPSNFKAYMQWVSKQLEVLGLPKDVLIGDLTPDDIEALDCKRFELIHG